MAVVGTAYVAIRAQDDGTFQATLVKDVGAAAKAAEEGATITPVVNTSKATGPLDVLKSKLQSFAGAGSPVTGAMNDIETATGGAGGALAGLATGGIAIAGAAIAAFAVKGISDFVSMTDQVRQFENVTGTSATQASEFTAAFRAIGVNVDSATSSLGRFSKNLQTNSQKFTDMGVQVAKTKDGTIDVTQTFLNLADTINQTSDAGAKDTLVLAAFGRGGQSLLPILEQGRQGIENLFGEAGKTHQLFSQDDLNRGLQMKEATNSLKESLAGLELEAGSALAPLATGLLESASQTIQLIGDVKDLIDWVNKVPGADLVGKVLGKGGGTNLNPLAILPSILHDITGSGGDATKSAAALAAAQTAAAESATQLATDAKSATDALAAQQKQETDLSAAVQGVSAAQRSFVSANTAVTAAKAKESDTTARLNDLLKAGTVNTQAVTQAQKDLTSAQQATAAAEDKLLQSGKAVQDSFNQLHDAVEAQSEAQDKLNRLISGQQAAEDLASHTHDLEHAQISVAQATLRQHDATAKLATVQANGTSTADDLLGANTDLEQANLDLKEAQENLTTTQGNLNSIQHEGDVGAQAYKTAQENLRLATLGAQGAADALNASLATQAKDQVDLTTAQQGVIDKTDALNAAMLPDPKLIAAIKTARDDVVTAHDNVATAEGNAAQKAYDLGTAQQDLTTKMGGGIATLQTVKENLQAIVALQPQAAAFLSPTLNQINALIAAALQVVQAPTDLQLKNLPAIQTSGGAVHTGGQQAYASGGFASGDFTAGEAGTELISLRPGGGAMVYAHGSPEAAGGDGLPPVSISIRASFGAGTNADDVVSAMRAVAQNEMTVALQSALRSANAGKRR